MGGEFRRGSGPNALPQGGASRLNRSQPAQDEMNDPAVQEVPVEFAPGEDDPVDNDDNGLGENMQVLLQPPDENYQSSLLPKDRGGRMPRYVVRHLPQLMAAVKDPDAPPTLRALYAATIRQLEMEQRIGGD